MIKKWIKNQAISYTKQAFFYLITRLWNITSYQPKMSFDEKFGNELEEAEKTSKRTISHFKMLMILAGISFFVVLISLNLGKYKIGYSKIIKIIFLGNDSENISKKILFSSRIPRILLAYFVGAGLSVSGVIYQSCFRNPLVEPYILGVSSGAGFGAGLSILFPVISIFGNHFSLQFFALFFAFTAVFLSWFIANPTREGSTVKTILSGVIISSVFTSCVAVLKYLATDYQLREIVFWILGGLYYAGWKEVMIVGGVTVLFTVVLALFSFRLNILSLGDSQAKTLGINPIFYRVFFVLLSTTITAVSVASAGVIPWVGLMIPHMCRIIFGNDTKWVILSSFFVGSIYLVVCDDIARAFFPAEIPVGIITSILGAPYLLFLIKTKTKEISI